MFHNQVCFFYSLDFEGVPVPKWLKCWTLTWSLERSNSIRAFTFTSGLISLRKVLTLLSSQLLVKQPHYCPSANLTLAVKKPAKVGMSLNKETERHHYTSMFHVFKKKKFFMTCL